MFLYYFKQFLYNPTKITYFILASKLNFNMNYGNIPVNLKSPNEINVIIEIPMDSGPVKYEFNQSFGCMVVDRFMACSMSYPCNYGFIPHTLSGDGDPVDVLVHTTSPIASGSIIRVKPIGMLLTEDEKGHDEKIVTIPTEKVDPYFKHINEYQDLPVTLLSKIEHFFQRYKDLEQNKWIKVNKWCSSTEAKKFIDKAVLFYQESKV